MAKNQFGGGGWIPYYAKQANTVYSRQTETPFATCSAKRYGKNGKVGERKNDKEKAAWDKKTFRKESLSTATPSSSEPRRVERLKARKKTRTTGKSQTGC